MCQHFTQEIYTFAQNKHTMEKKEIKLQMKESVFFAKYDEMIEFLLK